jgi:copper chaperone
VQRIDPAATLQIDLPSHRVSISSSAEPAKLVAALTEEGYPPAQA